MNEIKIATVWTTKDFKQTVIFTLLKTLSKKKITIVEPKNADLIIYGAYNWNQKLFHLYKFFLRKVKNEKLKDFIKKYQMKLINSSFFNRKYKPLTLFYNQEPLSYNYLETDFSISTHLGIDKENHLRYFFLKDSIDWSSEGFFRKENTVAKLFGRYIQLKELLIPQGENFLKKDRKICIFSSHMQEPRRIIFETFSKFFEVSGFGATFNKSIKNSDSSVDKKIDTFNNFAFNFCLENSIIPGHSSARVADAFVGKCLPITYAHQSINYDYNVNAFINLNDHFHDNFRSIIYNLQDDNFLRKFTKEPLLLKTLTLDKEIKFIQKILNYF